MAGIDPICFDNCVFCQMRLPFAYLANRDGSSDTCGASLDTPGWAGYEYKQPRPDEPVHPMESAISYTVTSNGTTDTTTTRMHMNP